MRTNRKATELSRLAIGMVHCLVLAGPLTAQIPCSYDVQIIASSNGCGGFGTVNTYGLGLNEHGAVVGYYKCPLWEHREAFLWTANEGFVTLDRPAGVSSAIAVDINDERVICGTALLSGLGFRGFVYEKGEWTILDPVVPDGGWSSASAINNAGTVVGQRSITEDLGPQNAYIWSANEGFTDLGVMNGPNSGANAVSENGLVAGWTGTGTTTSEVFLWRRGKITLLGFVPDGLTSTPSAMTDESVIVGWGRIPQDGFPFGISRAFRWANQDFQMLGTLSDHLLSASFDISVNTELIVGVSWYVDGNPNMSHGFVWEGGLMTNLDDLLPSRSEVSTRSAGAITNSGLIVADGTDAENNAVVFLLTPTEPLPWDLNGDCAIGAIDLLMLLNSWGPCANCNDCDADFDNNCVVGASDLLILLVNWG